MGNKPQPLSLEGLNPAQRDAFETALNDAWDDYQEQLSALIVEARTMVPNATYDDDDPLAAARAELAGYARKANLISQDYYRLVRSLWAEAAGVRLPDYREAQVTSDRAFWQVVGGYNSTRFTGTRFVDVINHRSRNGLTIDDLWARKTRDYTDEDWAALAKDIINSTARLTQQFTARDDPSQPKYARVPQGGKTCAFCTMLAGRDYVYASEDTAGKWHKYHPDCDCKVTCTWGSIGVEGYEPERFKAMYKAARAEAARHAKGKPTESDVLSWMRTMFSDMLTDGNRFDPDMRIPRGCELEKTLGRINTLRINKLLRNSQHPQTARLWAKYADRYRIIDTHWKGTAAFYPAEGGIRLKLKTIGKSDSVHRPYQLFFHETGHMLDWLLDDDGHMSSRNATKPGSFSYIIFTEAQKLRRETQKSLVERRNEDLKTIDRLTSELASTGRLGRKDLDWLSSQGFITDMKLAAKSEYADALALVLEKSREAIVLGEPGRVRTLKHLAAMVHEGADERDLDIDDILQSALGDDYPGIVCHDRGYFNAQSRPIESFADMLSAQIANQTSWKRIQHFLPESAKMFEDMIEEASR